MERIKVTVREVIAETPDAFSLVLENHPGGKAISCPTPAGRRCAEAVPPNWWKDKLK